MFEQIKKLDKEILLFMNSHHSLVSDNIMWFASGIESWFPLYAFIIILLIIKFKRGWLMILLIIPLMLMSDLFSSGVLKPLTQRLRPSHEAGLQNLLHYVNHYRGGLYSFPSSHACNFFAWVTYVCLVAAKKIKWLPYLLFPVALLVCYSRMYLGVHYPSDILGGAAIGAVIGWSFSKIFFWLNHLFLHKKINRDGYESF